MRADMLTLRSWRGPHALAWAGCVSLFFLLLSGCVLEQHPLFDADGDGVLDPDDCHDTDPTIGMRYRDADGDGFGDDAALVNDDCEGSDRVMQGGDCDDTSALIFPGQAESCNLLDDDCDTQVDEESTDARPFYQDLDDDGFGDLATEVLACAGSTGVGLVTIAGDCNDGDASIAPNQDETCDAQDEDCNGLIDDEPRNGTLYYPDQDGDGYGVSAGAVRYCAGDQPTNTAPQNGDCNDKNPNIYPGMQETCDGLDQDCDGDIDDAPLDGTLYYQDVDGDGDGSAASPMMACSLPPGYASSSNDCDDTNGDVSSLASERCNGRDDDCDGLKDEDFGDSDGSGISDCLEVAYVVSVGFVENGQGLARCYGKTNLDAQLSEMTALLGELGLTPVVYYDNVAQGISYERLAPYPLVIYDDGGWTDTPVPTTVQAFKEVRAAGKSLLFMGDDLVLQAAAVSTDYNDRSFFDLLGVVRLVAGGTMGRGVVATDSRHPVMNGPYGLVSSFSYAGDLDIAEATGDGTQSLATIQGAAAENPSILAYEKQGQRTLVLLPSAFATVINCPTSDTTGLEHLATLVKNGVAWLYGF